MLLLGPRLCANATNTKGYPEMSNAPEAKSWHCFLFLYQNVFSVIICCSDVNTNQNTSDVFDHTIKAGNNSLC